MTPKFLLTPLATWKGSSGGGFDKDEFDYPVERLGVGNWINA